MRKQITYTLFLVIIFSLFACGDNPIRMLNENEGRVQLVFQAPQYIQYVDLQLTSVDIEVIGNGISEPITDSTNLDNNRGKINVDVPEGKNRVIIATGRDESGPVVVTKGYVNVIAGEEAFTIVNWNTTPVGEVIQELLEEEYELIEQYNPGELQLLVNDKSIEVHPIEIDTKSIVKHIMEKGKNPEKLQLKEKVTVSGTVLQPDGVTPECFGVHVSINHPMLQDGKTVFPQVMTDANGRYSIPNITPGVWRLKTDGQGESDVQIKYDGTSIPGSPQITNRIPVQIETGIYGNTYYNSEFAFQISRPNDKWTLREADPNNPEEEAALVILEFSEGAIMPAEIAVSAVPGAPPGITCDDMVSAMIEILAGTPFRIIEERQKVINNIRACDFALQVDFGLFQMRGRFVFLIGGSNLYSIYLVAMESDVARIDPDFDKVLESFRVGESCQ